MDSEDASGSGAFSHVVRYRRATSESALHGDVDMLLDSDDASYGSTAPARSSSLPWPGHSKAQQGDYRKSFGHVAARARLLVTISVDKPKSELENQSFEK